MFLGVLRDQRHHHYHVHDRGISAHHQPAQEQIPEFQSSFWGHWDGWSEVSTWPLGIDWTIVKVEKYYALKARIKTSKTVDDFMFFGSIDKVFIDNTHNIIMIKYYHTASACYFTEALYIPMLIII